MAEVDFKNILENLDQAVLVVNYDSQIVWANRYFCSLFNTGIYIKTCN